jgi:hypothetical protein
MKSKIGVLTEHTINNSPYAKCLVYWTEAKALAVDISFGTQY